MVRQRVRSRGNIQVVLKHRFRRYLFGELNVTARMTESYLQWIGGFLSLDFVPGQKFVGERGFSKIQEFLHGLLAAGNTPASRSNFHFLYCHRIDFIHMVHSTSNICEPCTSGPTGTSRRQDRALHTASRRSVGTINNRNPPPPAPHSFPPKAPVSSADAYQRSISLFEIALARP